MIKLLSQLSLIIFTPLSIFANPIFFDCERSSSTVPKNGYWAMPEVLQYHNYSCFENNGERLCSGGNLVRMTIEKNNKNKVKNISFRHINFDQKYPVNDNNEEYIKIEMPGPKSDDDFSITLDTFDLVLKLTSYVYNPGFTEDSYFKCKVVERKF